MISDSVELCETAVCFLHTQLTATHVLFPKIHKTPPEVDLSPQDHQQSLSLETNPVDTAEPCDPHDNIVGSHLCDECLKYILPIVCRMPESIS